jgi:hypothetical protein
MKKTLLLLAVSLCFCLNTPAQNLSLSWISGPINNGDTIRASGDTTGTVSAYVDCKNESSSTITVKVRKKELMITQGTANYFCWANCYTPPVFVSPTGIDIPGDSVCHNFSGDYKAQGHVGNSYVLYTFFNISNANDTISVVVEYDCSLSGIGTVSSENVEFSNAYPNPAGDQTFFSFNLPTTAVNNSEIVLRDMLGNLVSYLRIIEKNGTIKLPTDKLNNGVYFYSLVIDEKVVLTKKLIIRH